MGAPWSLHTDGPVAPADLREALVKAAAARLRADERSRILEGLPDDPAVAAAASATRARMDRAIDAAVALAATGGSETVSVSISGDDSVDGLIDRVSVHVDHLAPAPVPPTEAEYEAEEERRLDLERR